MLDPTRRSSAVSRAWRSRATFLAFASLTLGCGAGHHNLTASIQGHSFSFEQGTARSLPAVAAFTIGLYDRTYPRCGDTPQRDSVRLDGVPAALGHYPLTKDVSVLFAGLDDFTVKDGGSIDVTELTTARIAGTVHVTVDAYVWADGDFRADICPWNHDDLDASTGD
jgi:hypothetical protein